MAMSRFEQILQAIVNGEECDLTPQSRAEVLLLALLDMIQSGSGTGTDENGNTVNLSNYYKKTETYSKTEVDTALAQKEDVLVYSLYKPSEAGSIGDIVYNKEPFGNSCVGWVYTVAGWLPFGVVENSKIKIDWDYDINFNSDTTFENTPFYFGDTQLGDFSDVNASKVFADHSCYKQLKNVNGYSSKLLENGMTENDYVLTGLPNSTANNEWNAQIGSEFVHDSSSVTENSDDCSNYILEFDACITSATNETAPNVSYDLIEFTNQVSRNTSYSYGITGDGRIRQYVKNEDGTLDGFGMFEDGDGCIGRIPLDRWVNIRIVIKDYDTFEMFIDGEKIETVGYWYDPADNENDIRKWYASIRCDYILLKGIRIKKYSSGEYDI